jgi:hypothetical protein
MGKWAASGGLTKGIFSSVVRSGDTYLKYQLCRINLAIKSGFLSVVQEPVYVTRVEVLGYTFWMTRMPRDLTSLLLGALGELFACQLHTLALMALYRV